MKNNTADLLIVGGGVIGAAVAYFVSSLGLKVILLEAGDLAAGTSGACNGTVMIQSKKLGFHTSLTSESIKLFQSLNEIIPDIDFQQHGSLFFIEDEEQLNYMREMGEERNNLDIKMEIVDDLHFFSQIPIIHTKNILGASYCPLDGLVDPLSLCLTLTTKAKSLGAQIDIYSNVLDFIKKGDRILGVKTEEKDYYGENTILTTGVYSNNLLKKIDFSLPISSIKGQVMVTEHLPPVCPMSLHEARYLVVKYDREYLESEAANYGITLGVHQTRHGNLMVGASKEANAWNRETSLKVCQEIAGNTKRFVNIPAETRIIRSFAGLRPSTPDALPLIGPLPYESLYVATGHGGDGIALSLITGKLVSEMIAGDITTLPLEPLDPCRFPIENT